MSQDVTDPLKWSAEEPNLYTLVADPEGFADGRVLEVVPWRLGFRRVEIKSGQMLVNGRPS